MISRRGVLLAGFLTAIALILALTTLLPPAAEDRIEAQGHPSDLRNLEPAFLIHEDSKPRKTLTQPVQLTSTPTSRSVGPPVPLPGSESRHFPETGKTVSGVFLRYWETHGGLAQQGYPISEVMGEISELDGKPYTIQYFERAVFEYHPENRGTVYEVLLSHLGRFRWDERYSVPSYTTQLIAKEIGTGPVRAGKYLIWKGTTPNNFIYVYNLENGRMASTPAYLSPPGHDIASDGATVVWKEGTSIVGYDIATGRRWTVLQADTSHGIGGLALDAGVLYYVDETYERTTGSRTDSLYSLNLTTQEKRLISSQGQNPVARDGVLLWRENKNGPFYPPADLHALRLDSSDRDRVIATLDRGLPRYDVSDDKVAWTTYLKQEYSRAQDPNIHLYDLATGTVESIPAEVDIYARPLISGNRVVWTQELGAGGYGVHPSQWKIWEYNVSTRQTRLLLEQSAIWLGAVAILDDGAVAYATGLSYTNDLYILRPTRK